MDALKLMSESCLKKDLPVVNVGDTVRVQVRIQEGNRERLQAFEGTVIAKKHPLFQLGFLVVLLKSLL